MSALAEYLRARGVRVTGCDAVRGVYAARLAAKGVEIGVPRLDDAFDDQDDFSAGDFSDEEEEEDEEIEESDDDLDDDFNYDIDDVDTSDLDEEEEEEEEDDEDEEL